MREEVEPRVMDDAALEGRWAEVEREVGVFDEARGVGGEGGDGVVVEPFGGVFHAEEGDDGVEGAEDVHFAEGEEVVGGRGAEGVAFEGGEAELFEEGGGIVEADAAAREGEGLRGGFGICIADGEGRAGGAGRWSGVGVGG